MDPDRRTAVIAGVLFIIATIAALLAAALTPVLTGADYLVEVATRSYGIAAFTSGYRGLALSHVQAMERWKGGLRHSWALASAIQRGTRPASDQKRMSGQWTVLRPDLLPLPTFDPHTPYPHSMVALAVIGLLVLLVAFYAISIYNKLVKLKNLVAEAWSGIDVQLKKRYDLIPNLVETVKGYAAHEKETFENVTRARAAAQQATTVEGQQAAEKQLSGALMNLIAVAERYPDLKANTNFLELQNMLSVVEGDIEKARRYYNGNVRDQNTLIESFPSNIIANMFSFVKSAFFELDNPAHKENPAVKFS